MVEDRGRCGWGAVVAAVALCASLVLVTPAAATPPSHFRHAAGLAIQQVWETTGVARLP